MSDTPQLALEIEKLLVPISSEQTAGESLRYEGTYDAIAEARREEPDGLSQGIYVTSRKKADWEQVEKLCLEALETRTKDLQLAVWLLEAWIHRYGFEGATKGLEVIIALSENFWDELHPALEDGDFEARFAPLEWMDEKLSVKLKQIPMTKPDLGDLPSYGFLDKERTDQLEQAALSDKKVKETPDSSQKVTRSRFLTSVTLTPSSFYHLRAREIADTRKAVDKLESLLRTKLGDEVHLFRFKNVLVQIQQFVESVIEERGEDEVEERVRDEQVPAGEEQMKGDATTRNHHIRNRADAYRMLWEASEYLIRNEPHSPAPYLIKRAVSWGSMTFVELIRELVHSTDDLGKVYDLLGIDKTENGEST